MIFLFKKRKKLKVKLIYWSLYSMYNERAENMPNINNIKFNKYFYNINFNKYYVMNKKIFNT